MDSRHFPFMVMVNLGKSRKSCGPDPVTKVDEDTALCFDEPVFLGSHWVAAFTVLLTTPCKDTADKAFPELCEKLAVLMGIVCSQGGDGFSEGYMAMCFLLSLGNHSIC